MDRLRIRYIVLVIEVKHFRTCDDNRFTSKTKIKEKGLLDKSNSFSLVKKTTLNISNKSRIKGRTR